jgi:hypothetical protein
VRSPSGQLDLYARADILPGAAGRVLPIPSRGLVGPRRSGALVVRSASKSRGPTVRLGRKISIDQHAYPLGGQRCAPWMTFTISTASARSSTR